MSTIIFKDGVLCADTRGYSGHNMAAGRKTKIATTPAGTLVGVSTTIPGMGEAFMRWLQGDREDFFETDKEMNLTALEILPDGRWLLYEDSQFPSGPLEGDFIAIGSGAYYAIGAMEMGATALGALEVAAIHDVWTQTPYTVLTFKDAPVKPPAPPKDESEDDEGGEDAA